MTLKNKTLLFVDSGSFFEMALALTKYFKEVLYYVQWTSSFPGPEKYRIGTEWKNNVQQDQFDGKPLRRIESIWNNLKDTDMVMIADVYDGDIADHLRELGYPVLHAGSKGAEIELDRWHMLKELKGAGMDVPNVIKVQGLTNLKDKLQTLKDKWIKISRFRHITETFHHETWELSQPIIEKMEYELGSLKETIEFLIWDPIEAITESGYDGYTVKGKYPKNTLYGAEVKDKAYFGEIVPFTKMPLPVQKTTTQLSTVLAKTDYQGFFATEVRITGNKSYMIDATCRSSYPPSPLFPLLFKNLGEIVWELGQGNVVDIDPIAKYGLFLAITTDHTDGNQPIFFDEKYRDNIKLNYPVKVDGKYHIINLNKFPEIGCVCTVGNSYEECYKQMEEIVSTIKGYGINIDLDDCEKAKIEFEKMSKS